jgi:hypothetical protein
MSSHHDAGAGFALSNKSEAAREINYPRETPVADREVV